MKISQCRDDQRVVRLALSGELDMAAAEALHNSVHHALTPDPPDHLIIDLAGLTFCDSTGVRALVDARSTALDSRVAFQAVNPRGPTHRVMHVTGVLDVLTTVQPT